VDAQRRQVAGRRNVDDAEQERGRIALNVLQWLWLVPMTWRSPAQAQDAR
jgi:hypothetical protein